MMAILQAFFTQYGYVAVFGVLFACAFGLPIPEDITLVTGGVIAQLGEGNVHLMVLVGLAGVLCGDGLMFMAGRLLGPKILQFKYVQRIMSPQRYAQVQEKFDRYGNRVLFVARFLPGLRTPIFISAGMSGKISPWQFLLMDGLAALISVPLWVYLGAYGAENKDWLMHKVHQFQTGIYVLLAVGAVWLAAFWLRKIRRSRFFREQLAAGRAKRKPPHSDL